ncbi:MAG: hypothetical protein H7175_02015, partial [Burkholderiales bacterium]|nr:hypothetical protein [Anaerolineae bacterium]
AFLVLEDSGVESALPEELQEEIRDLAAQIVSGDIVVTDFLAPAEEATPEAEVTEAA